MVSTRSKTVVGISVCDQIEPSKKDVSVQTHSCPECLSLSVALGGAVEEACLQCEQVNDLLSLVAELREEVERLRSIRESEMEIDWWSSALPSLREASDCESEDLHASCSQVIEGHLINEEEWKWVPAQGDNNKNSSPSLSQVPLQNRYEVLDLEGQLDDLEENCLPVSPPIMIHLKDASPPLTSRRRVIVVGDSLLRGSEGPICQPDPSHREVCCLPGARVQNITERLPVLIQPSDYYPLLILQAGSDEIEKRSVKAIKRDFRALGQAIDRAGAQVVFCSVPLVAEENDERNRRTHIINKWLKGWCHRQNFGFFDHGEIFTTPALLEPNGIHLSVKGKRFLTHELAELVERALN
ncbi:hypothetical protein DUI87_01039 [Hirundo rustica rustica]|uniref:SGNH hydrolase-type esterase domain-containing protein n=1 Tax=Hirundo rustica rustica TaxID=333673 RepID=A0A3M0L4K4_HIRRU|nr:hypothetical protein DUI87_01039 [Hirundo rustica rustica]